MDFDFRIRLLEKELAHYREMQDLVRARLDTHDNSIEAIADALVRLTKSQEQTNESVKTVAESIKTLAGDLKILADTVGVLAQKVTGFIDALRASSNGKPAA
jgi:archaellum component FlaC